MMRSKLVWCLVIFCFMHLQHETSAVKKSRDSLRIKEGFLFIGQNSFDEGNLVFAVCHKNSTSLTTCNVVQKIYPDKKTNRSCTITVKGDHKESRLNARIGVATLGKNKAILYWGDNYNNASYAKVGTLDLETCIMNEFAIDDPEKEVLLDFFYTDMMVAYENNSFDVFFNDSRRCGEKLCVMLINEDGTVKSQAKVSNLLANGYQVSPIASRSPSKGYAYTKKDNGLDYELLLVKPDGVEKLLDSFDTSARPTVSASRNVITACTKANVDTDVTCTQYDENGNVKFTANIPEVYKNTQARAVHNLADGGALVVVAEMINCDHLLNCDETNYHMVRIASDGKIMGIARTVEFDSVTSQWKYNYAYKYGESEYCAALIGQNPILDDLRLSNYEIVFHCVTEDEFLY